MRFLNPNTDFAFKKIFGSNESKDILISFTNAMLRFHPGHEIVDLTIIDPYQAPKIKGMKDTYLDVKAISKDGREFIIEMQVLNVAGFEKRILYNAAKAYSMQLGEAEDYPNLNPVIALTITDFIMFEASSKIISKFCLLDKDDFFKYPNSDLELVFVELPKFTKTEEQLVDITDKWIYFLKKAGSLEIVPKTLKVEKPIYRAFEIANKANLTREELDDQERREIFIQDQRGALTKAVTKADEVGFKRGLQEGRQEGLQKGMELAAQNLYDLYCERIITSEQAKSQLEKLYANNSLSEDIYREFVSKI